MLSTAPSFRSERNQLIGMPNIPNIQDADPNYTISRCLPFNNYEQFETMRICLDYCRAALSVTYGFGN